MNTQEAILFLSNKGIKVYQDGEKYFINGYSPYSKEEVWYNGRELVKLARIMRDSGSIPSLGKNVKHFSNSKDRARTRDLVAVGDFDSIPANKRAKSDDKWNWD